MKIFNIPDELINLILEYDGRIKYRKNEYVNIIHKHDTRYNIIEPILTKKIKILETAEIYSDCFYFEFGFDINRNVGLCYDFNFTFPGKFEICYYDMRNNGWQQIRTYL
jgi:hypothetical protein